MKSNIKKFKKTPEFWLNHDVGDRVSNIEVGGVRIDDLDMAAAMERIEAFLNDDTGRQRYVVTPNPEFIVRAQTDGEFKDILNKADMSIADGIGLVFVSQILSRPLKTRLTGIDLMEKICQRAALKKWPVFLIGGRGDVAKKAVRNLKNCYSGLDISSIDCGKISQDGFGSFGSVGPGVKNGILFVGLGAGKQEKFIARNLAGLPQIKLAVGVGGSFDVLAGRLKRAPMIFRKAGFEWLWRLALQPSRAPRIFRAVVKFPLLIIANRFKNMSS